MTWRPRCGEWPSNYIGIIAIVMTAIANRYIPIRDTCTTSLTLKSARRYIPSRLCKPWLGAWAPSFTWQRHFAAHCIWAWLNPDTCGNGEIKRSVPLIPLSHLHAKLSVWVFEDLVIVLHKQKPKLVRGGWSHNTDTSELVVGYGANNIKTWYSDIRWSHCGKFHTSWCSPLTCCRTLLLFFPALLTTWRHFLACFRDPTRYFHWQERTFFF
jgi:hypothetical protein